MPDTAKVLKLKTQPGVAVRRPRADDGTDVNDLIGRCKPLDENSIYCNLLQCSHFADTSAVAEVNGQVQGFTSGYIVPARQDRLFIWQVAVASAARGKKLGMAMILDILRRPICRDVRELHTTITRDNKASQAVFRSVAKTLETEAATNVLFHEEEHFDGQQSSEVLWRIGPFDRSALIAGLTEAA
ncbi:MAG: diaminobutyrate acetyltransferase [Rhodovibrionaceae bacterium]